MNLSGLVGSHPQPLRYYLGLAGGTLRTMLDLEMLVVGSALVGLSVAVFLDGLEVVSIGLGLSTGAMLGSALVLGVVGAFAFGIASEGGYGAAASVAHYPPLEVVAGRAVFGVLVSVVLLVVSGWLEAITAGMTVPLRAGAEALRATGLVGVGVSLLGSPLVWMLKRSLDRLGWGRGIELPVLYVVWILGVLGVYSMPTG